MSRALAGFMLRTGATPLRALWAAAYEIVTRAAVMCIRRQNRNASVYLKGSFASGEPVYGISDVDLVVVIPGDPSRPGSAQLDARERWKKLCRRIPLFGSVIQHAWFYERDDLEKSTSTTCLTYGLARGKSSDDSAAFMGTHALYDHMGLQTHPTLYGARGEWRHISGSGAGQALPH